MPINFKEVNEGRLVEVQLSGKLNKGDYEHFAPEVGELIKKHGKIDILLQMTEFHGWDAGALWDDIKFDLKHFAHIGRIAMVGNKKWEKWMASFCRPFTTAKIKYFDESEANDANTWIRAV